MANMNESVVIAMIDKYLKEDTISDEWVEALLYVKELLKQRINRSDD